MMIKRLDYTQINSPAINDLLALKKQITTIDKRLTALVELRVSQINGCVYCIDLHAQQARALGESQKRLDCLSAWHECSFFDDREKAAFTWADTVTNISETRADSHIYDLVKQHFSDKEMVDLTLIISLMNTWNRLAISFQHIPE